MCWRAGIASPPAYSAFAQYGGYHLLMHEGLEDAVGGRMYLCWQSRSRTAGAPG